MSMFENFPYTNLHEINLQWIIEEIKKCYSPDNPPESMVISVNGESGIVTLYKDARIAFPDIDSIQWNMYRGSDGVITGIEFNKDAPATRINGNFRFAIYDAGNPPPYPVVSVNGATGAIELYTEAYLEFPDLEGDNWGIQRKLNADTENEIMIGLMLNDTGSLSIIKGEDSIPVYSQDNPPPYPVRSVDGMTGNVNTWGYNQQQQINFPRPSSDDSWSLGRTIDQGGNLSIKLMYDDNIRKCSAYMVYNDGVNTPTPVRLLTLEDIPSSSGVVSFNGQTGAVTADATNLGMGGNDNRSIAVAIGDLVDDEYQMDNAITYTERGDTASQNIPLGKYVIWKNNPYISIANISSGDTLSSSNLLSLDHGIIDNLLNSVNSQATQINTLNNKLKFGNWTTNVTLPYEAPADGFITIYLNPATASGAYARFNISSGNAHAMGLNATGGDGVSLSFPIKKGGRVSQAVLNNGTYTVRFIPLFPE